MEATGDSRELSPAPALPGDSGCGVARGAPPQEWGWGWQPWVSQGGCAGTGHPGDTGDSEEPPPAHGTPKPPQSRFWSSPEGLGSAGAARTSRPQSATGDPSLGTVVSVCPRGQCQAGEGTASPAAQGGTEAQVGSRWDQSTPEQDPKGSYSGTGVLAGHPGLALLVTRRRTRPCATPAG